MFMELWLLLELLVGVIGVMAAVLFSSFSVLNVMLIFMLKIVFLSMNVL